MKCYVCGIEGPDKNTWEAANNWNWFSGYLKETVHFCPEHKNSEQHNHLFSIRENKEELAKIGLLRAEKENPSRGKCPTCNGTGRVNL